MLFGLGLVEIISLPRKGVFRRVFLANHLGGGNYIQVSIELHIELHITHHSRVF